MIPKINLTVLIWVLSILMVTGQDFVKEFGKIEQDEIELKEYALDKNAEAIVLFDIATSHFVESDNSFNVVFERTTRIKILSEAGIKWAEVEIPFYQEGKMFERVYDIEAASYNFENGKLNKSSVDALKTYDEKRDEYWNIRKFAISNVKVGSIIEYRYKISSPYKFNLRDWEFQWRIPVVYSEYVARMIPFYEYTFVLQGAKKFDIYESYVDKGGQKRFGTATAFVDNSYQDMVFKFGMMNVPAFGDEEFITSINDYVVKLDFQLAAVHDVVGSNYNVISTWDDLIKELMKHQDFGKYVSKSKNIAQKVFDVKSLSKKSEIEKFDTVLDYVKSNYNWNNYNAYLAIKSPGQLVDDKMGNCAEINLFTVGLLNEVGIESFPIIMSTRDHGKIKLDYPFLNFFNYVIIMSIVDGKEILSDATEIFTMNDRIPPRCLNDRGLIIKKDKVDWVNLECLLTSVITTVTQIEFDENRVSVDLQKTGTEYDALSLRNNYSDKIEKVKKSLPTNIYSLKDSTINVQNYLDKTKPYTLNYSFTAKPEVVNNKIYMSPFMLESISDNPLKQRDRKYPIDMMYPKKRAYSSTLTLPKGYQLDFKPEDLSISNESFELNYSIQTIGDKLQVTFDYYFKKPIYQSADYSKVKFYFSEIVKKGNEKIVFVKTAGKQAQ